MKNVAAALLESANIAPFARIFVQSLIFLFVGVHDRSVQMLVGF